MKNEKVAFIITITVMIACILGITAICYNYFKDDVLENNEISNIENGDIEEFINSYKKTIATGKEVIYYVS